MNKDIMKQTNLPLIVAVSARTLFNMEDGHAIYEKEGQAAFDKYNFKKRKTPLRPGLAANLVQKLIKLNSDGVARVKLVILSRNSTTAAMRVMSSIQHYGWDNAIESAIFCQGSDRYRYAREIGVDLFLSATHADVEKAIANGVSAATVVPKETNLLEPNDPSLIKFAFDFDGILANKSADDIYLAKGLEAFQASELENAEVPLEDGPMMNLLAKLNVLQKSFPNGKSPLNIAIVTARGVKVYERVYNTLSKRGVGVDEAIFAGGMPKGPLLKAYGADFFFDDVKKNIDSAHSCDIPSGHVPFGDGMGIVTAA